MQIIVKFQEDDKIMTKHEYKDVQAEYVDLSDNDIENDIVTIVVSKRSTFPKQEDFIKAGTI